MVLEDANNNKTDYNGTIHAPAETLVCRVCRKEYMSRGKYDPGYCQDCEQKMIEGSAVFIGGPLDGQRVSDVK